MGLTSTEVLCSDPAVSTSDPLRGAEPLYDDPEHSNRNPATGPV